MTTGRQRLQQRVVTRSLQDMYKQMVRFCNNIPEGADLAQDAKACELACNVWAIEEEWILDPELREELSLIQSIPPEEGS